MKHDRLIALLGAVTIAATLPLSGFAQSKKHKPKAPPKPPRTQGPVGSPVAGPGAVNAPAGSSVSPTVIKNIELAFLTSGQPRRGGFIALSARLTYGGESVANKRINFYEGNRFLGAVTTSGTGEATLSYQIPVNERRPAVSFRAEFSGDIYYYPAKATANLAMPG